MDPTVSAVVLADGLELSVAVQGQPSRLPLVLLPGPTDSWRSYAPVLDRLPDDVGAVAVSLRGHGTSDKPASGYTIADVAGDVVALLDALGVQQAVLVGHSASTFVARRVAIDAPSRVAGLVLEAAPLTLVGDAGLTEFVESKVAGLADPIDPDFARSWIADTSTDGMDPQFVDQLVEDVCLVPAHVWRQVFADLLTCDDRDRLSSVEAPTLLIWGSGDRLVGLDAQEALRSAIAGAELVEYEGVGHTPRWEDPARFAADLASFVRAIERGEA